MYLHFNDLCFIIAILKYVHYKFNGIYCGWILFFILTKFIVNIHSSLYLVHLAVKWNSLSRFKIYHLLTFLHNAYQSHSYYRWNHCFHFLILHYISLTWYWIFFFYFKIVFIHNHFINLVYKLCPLLLNKSSKKNNKIHLNVIIWYALLCRKFYVICQQVSL